MRQQRLPGPIDGFPYWEPTQAIFKLPLSPLGLEQLAIEVEHGANVPLPVRVLVRWQPSAR